ncbi:hypothetical protein BaRGS_00002861 [Batillaria attramentaria]|uniref:Uncharacterized protein n=1 Tax=Batillaria attramentaria TaxID=370345 RepID=A0ABD0M456_9CAEN
MVMVTCLPASALQDREKWPGNTTAELRFSFDMTSISTSRPRCDLDAGYSESFQEQSQVIAGDVDEKELHASTPTTPPRPQLEVVYESPRKGVRAPIKERKGSNEAFITLTYSDALVVLQKFLISA